MNWERPLTTFLESNHPSFMPGATLARDLCRQKKYGQALEVLWKMLRTARSAGSKEQEAFVLIHMGNVYRNWIPEVALKFYQDGLAAARSCSFKPGQMAAHNAMGQLHYVLGEPDKALEHYKLSLQSACDTRDRISERDILLDMVNCYDEQGDLERCDELLRMAQHLEEAIDEETPVRSCALERMTDGLERNE